MSLRQIKAGTLNNSVVIRIIDATSGVPEQAVEHDTAGIDLWYRREGGLRVAITEAALAALDTAHTDGGIEHMDDGYYRLDLPDAACAAGAVGVMVGGAVTDMIVIGSYIDLVTYDPQDTVRLGLTALPNAAADAANGLPVSDAGGLDLDTRLANTNEITAARMGALTDWINGGRLDLLLDAIPTTAMRGTDSAALASVCTETRLAELDAANLPTDVSAIPTTAMRGTDSAALASVATEARLAELDAANLPTDVAAIPTTAMRGTDSAALASVCTEARLAELAAANLPADLDTLLTRITAAIATKAEMDTAHGLLATPAEVNAEVKDVLETDTHAEIGQEAPPATAALAYMIRLLYKALRNLKKQDNGTFELYNDAGDTVDQKATAADDGTDASMAELVSGP